MKKRKSTKTALVKAKRKRGHPTHTVNSSLVVSFKKGWLVLQKFKTYKIGKRKVGKVKTETAAIKIKKPV